MPGTAGPASALQVARYGHIAAALRQFMAEKQWKPSDLNRALGLPKSSTRIYPWLAAKGAPLPDAVAKLTKITGLDRKLLTARDVDATAQQQLTLIPVKIGPAARAADVLSFTVSADGTARIRLDVQLPLATATPLLRMLLDAGVTFTHGNEEG